MELTTDTLKLEQELERVINSDSDTEQKIALIKSILSKMAVVEASLLKLASMTNNTNNNNTTPEKDGQND